LIGSYEHELHPIIEALIDKNFPLIINVGSADGYFAAGFARRCKTSRIVAFEMDDELRQDSINNAKINGLYDRISFEGKCASNSLMQYDLSNALIFMDCEGAEIDILDESVLPYLSTAWLLIELHDALRSGCSRILSKRFDATHDCSFLSATERDPQEFELPKNLSHRERFLALDEKRLGTQEWVLMTPKSH
jgi:hypothetical protein